MKNNEQDTTWGDLQTGAVLPTVYTAPTTYKQQPLLPTLQDVRQAASNLTA